MRRGVLIKWAGVLASLFLMAAPGWANYLPGCIEGHVIDVDKDPDEPLAGLGVSMTTKDGYGSWYTTTDSSGHYSFSYIYAGDYKVHIWPGAKYGGGYPGFTKDCSVAGGQTTTVDFDLTHLQPGVKVEVLEPTGEDSIGGAIKVKLRITSQPGAYDLQNLTLWIWDSLIPRSVTLSDGSLQGWEYGQTHYDENYETMTQEVSTWWWSTYGWDDYPQWLNGANTVCVSAIFSNPWGDPIHKGEKPTSTAQNGDPTVSIGVDLKNLVITSASPDFYPVGGSFTPPQVSVNYDVYDLDTPVTAIITVRATPQPTQSIRTITMSNITGGSFTFQWDGLDQYGNTPDACYYTYDVELYDYAAYDSASWRSKRIAVGSHDLSFLMSDADEQTGECAIAYTDATPALGTALVSYSLSTVPAADSVVVYLANQALALEDTSATLSDQERASPNQVQLHFEGPDHTQDVAKMRALITAKDNCGPGYRGRANKAMLPTNKEKGVQKRRRCLQYILNRERVSHLYVMGRDGNATSWSTLKSYSATSGDSSHLNQPAKDNWDYDMGAAIGLTAEMAASPWFAVGFESTMQTGMHLTENGQEVGYKFFLHDANDNGEPENRVYPSAAGHTGRQCLRIHPDGGALGSEGCIAVQNGDCAEARRYLKYVLWDKFNAKNDWQNVPHRSIPLYVRTSPTNSSNDLELWVEYDSAE